MGVFDFALKMELDGEQYYREHATQAKYADLKTVLIGLAEDEKRHFAIVESLQKKKATPTSRQILLSANSEMFLNLPTTKILSQKTRSLLPSLKRSRLMFIGRL